MSAIPLRFRTGDTLSIRGHAGSLDIWRIEGRKMSGYLLSPTDGGDPRTWSDSEIADLYFERRLVLHPCNKQNLPAPMADALERTWDFWPEEVRATAMRRLEFVKYVDIVRAEHSTLLEAYAAAAEAVHARNVADWTLEDVEFAAKRRAEESRRERRDPDLNEGPPPKKDPGPSKPGPYTVRDWYVMWSMHGRDVRLLIPHYHKRGNRKSRFATEPGDKPDTYKLMRQACEEFYFKPLKVTKDYVYGRYTEMCKAANIKCVSSRTFRKFIAEQFDDKFECIKRYGRRVAWLKFNIFDRRTPPERPLEEVEIDHCLIDLLVVHPDSGKVIGRPWLTAVIDRATRVILGAHLSFEASYGSVQRAIAHAMWPKDLRGLEGLDHGWDCHGVWDVIYIDNGRDFRGNGLRTSANLLDFSVIPLPTKSPWLKGTIERLFGRMNVQVFSHEEGSTLSRTDGHYDPAKQARVTMSELQSKIVKWIVDEYHETEHTTLRCAPMKRWRELTTLYPVRPVPDFDHIVRLTGDVIKRKISNVGVHIYGLLYADADNDHRNLKRLIARRGGLQKDWLIRCDPYDLGEIWVLDDQTGEWLDLPCTEQAISRGVSRYQHKIHRLIAQKSTDKGIPITPSMLGRAKALALAEATQVLAGSSKHKNAGRASRYSSSPGYLTPLFGAGEPQISPQIRSAKPPVMQVDVPPPAQQAGSAILPVDLTAESLPEAPEMLVQSTESEFDVAAAVAEQMALWE